MGSIVSSAGEVQGVPTSQPPSQESDALSHRTIRFYCRNQPGSLDAVRQILILRPTRGSYGACSGFRPIKSHTTSESQKALGAKARSETLQRALDLVTEKAERDRISQRYSGIGKPDAFGEDH